MKLSFTILLAFAALSLLAGGGRSAAQQKSAAPKKDAAPAAAEAQPRVSEIKEAGLKSLLEVSAAKQRPLLVNFWATWCTPCREEFPDLVRIREQYKPEALDFVTVSLDDVSEIGTSVPEFLGQMRATAMPAYLLNADDPSAAITLVDQTWHGELPATFLFDRRGQLSYKHKGRIKPAEVRAAIERTLNDTTQTASGQQ